MRRRKIYFRDPVVERVVDKFVSRSDVGYEKYGRTLDSERTGGHKDLFGYLNDVQEELMDAILYLQAAKEEFSDLSEEAALERTRVIGQNGNEGTHYNQEKCHDDFVYFYKTNYSADEKTI
tara:strand:+ start:249 stop:611 length:363 start_codon:yes stop_codon:yes gene_type:complete